MRSLGSSDEWTFAVEEILRACGRITIVAPWVDSDVGRWPLWSLLRASQPRVHRVYAAAEDMRSEPTALAELHTWGVLRWLPVADASMRASLIRGVGADGADGTHTILGSGPLARAGWLAPLVSAVEHRGTGFCAFDLETDGMVQRVADQARLPTQESLDAYYAAFVETTPLRDRLLSIGASLGVALPVEAIDVDLELVTGSPEIARAARSLSEILAAGATSTRPHTLASMAGVRCSMSAGSLRSASGLHTRSYPGGIAMPSASRRRPPTFPWGSRSRSMSHLSVWSERSAERSRDADRLAARTSSTAEGSAVERRVSARSSSGADFGGAPS